MAITRGIGIGKMRGSMGDITYRQVRGRTVTSEKIGPRDTPVTRVPGAIMSHQQAIFGMVSTFMQAHASDIDVSFNKTKYGSQRNYFYKINKAALSDALSALADTAMFDGYPALSDIEAAITEYATINPAKIYRVRLAGFEPVYLTGQWSQDDNPISGAGTNNDIAKGTVSATEGDNKYTAPCATSMEFRSGAKIVRPAALTSIKCGGIPANVVANDITFLTANGTPVSGLAVTSVTSSKAGSIEYNAPAITEAQNVLAVKVSNVYVRLTSAYVRNDGGGVDPNPFG